jgi:pentatricopeptide repeat protein
LDLASNLVASEMRDFHGVAPTRMVWSCLITCCVKSRDFHRAILVLDHLDRDGQDAIAGTRASMYAAVIEGCLSNAEASLAVQLCERAYSRSSAEEGKNGVGILSLDLLRRVFEAAGSSGRVAEADARVVLDSIAFRLGDQVRASLKEALGRRGRSRAVGGGTSAEGEDRDASTSVSPELAIPNEDPHEGAAGSYSGSLLKDLLKGNNASAMRSDGFYGSAGHQPWAPHSQYSALELSSIAYWDPIMAAAMAGAANPWSWPQEGLDGQFGFGGMMGSYDPYYAREYPDWHSAWPHSSAPTWEVAALAEGANANAKLESPGDDPSEPVGEAAEVGEEGGAAKLGVTSKVASSIEGPPGLC